jgi:protein-tyrosine phosphatase
MRASPAQRGGWLSAEKRRRKLAASPHVSMDASNIVPRLWVGSRPPLDRDLPEFDMLVLCAQEIQPARVGFAKQLLRCPIPDSALSSDELRRAVAASGHVAQALRGGKRVLVTCAAGLNRSAFVAALALGRVTHATPDELVAIMRKRRRPEALSNPHFVGYLNKLINRRR